MTRPRIHAVLVLIVLALAVPGRTAAAQSDLDLRDENEALKTQVGDLQRELDAARQRIADLEAEIEQLRRLLASSPPAPATPASAPDPQVTIDESKPSASPRAVFKALREGYAAATADLEIGDLDSRQRTAYLRAVDSWAKRVQRELRTPIEWHVRLMPENEQTAGDIGLRWEAVDPVTHAVLGEPFTMRLPQRVARKFTQLSRAQQQGVLVLKGVLQPRVNVEPNREIAGAFDNPRLIGPFAEFGLQIEPTSLTVPGEEEGEEEPAPGG